MFIINPTVSLISIMIVLMVYSPGGLIGLGEKLVDRWRAPKARKDMAGGTGL